MKMTITKDELKTYITMQCNMHFPDSYVIDQEILLKGIELALKRLEKCMLGLEGKYYDEKCFHYLNGDHYCMFLYLLVNSLYKLKADTNLLDKLFLLNKVLHNIDVFYEVELPETFLFVHPIGTVLGRAKYGNHFTVYQGCNVGSNKGKYPVIGERCVTHPYSSILGDTIVGNDVDIATHCVVLDGNVQEGIICINYPKQLIFKEKNKFISNKEDIKKYETKVL